MSQPEQDRDHNQRIVEPPVRNATWPIAGLVVIAAVAGFVFWLQIDRTGLRGNRLPEQFQYPIDENAKIDPALIAYQQVGLLRLPCSQGRAIAIDEKDKVYVACEDGILILTTEGKTLKQIPLDDAPNAVGIAPPNHVGKGRIYVSVGRTILVLDENGQLVHSWQVPGKRVFVTSIAVGESDVFVANCLESVVLRFTPEGRLQNKIGEPNPDAGVPGLVVPSSFLDIAIGPNDLLWVINPGLRRIEAYNRQGRLELFWTKGGTIAVEDFFGCCNPANFAILPDGSFVTAEKGLLRIKVYSADGRLREVVAGPEQLDTAEESSVTDPFDHEHKALDVAVDNQGRIFALRLGGNSVRIFQRKSASAKTGIAKQQEQVK